ncbi:hypothetical protein DRO69_03020 [Candidatus Bathyarchaeota archaeon]|nr:MAG: hypothetical protein DRO69_03020 [Candidatus Bathyarchaeota archaeon]
MVLKRFSKRTLFVLLVFFVALIGAITAYAYVQRRSITREEAIEISTNSERIQSIWHIVEDADWYTVKADYLNRTRINELKEQDPQYYEFLPYAHGVWLVEWEIGPSKYGPGRIIVIHFIDEKTGKILHEDGAIL